MIASIPVLYYGHQGCVDACTTLQDSQRTTCVIEKVSDDQPAALYPGSEWPPGKAMTLVIYPQQSPEAKYVHRQATAADQARIEEECLWDGTGPPKLRWLDCGIACLPEF